MKVLRAIVFTLIAIAFGLAAGVIIGGVTLAAGILILRDAIFRRNNPNSAIRNPHS